MLLSSADPVYLDQCRAALAAEQAKSLAETNNWSHVDKAQIHADWQVLYTGMAAALDGLAADSEVAQGWIAQHCGIASRFYPPSKDAYIGLALFYEENADMKAYHNAYHPQMVAFLGDAIYTYAMTRM